jgi:hypothetical protein
MSSNFLVRARKSATTIVERAFTAVILRASMCASEQTLLF